MDVVLPELGESVVEATLGPWLVKEGDRVDLDQPLVEVTTDKADAELPSPAAGVIEKILVAEGETVGVGTALARIAEGAEASPRPSQAAPKPEPEPEPAQAPARQARPTPVAARMAREVEVDVSRLPGSGPGGRVSKRDVAEAARAPSASPPAARPEPARVAGPATPPARPPYARYELQPGDRVIPMTPLRRIVAEHMVYSKHVSPHVGTVAEVDVSGVARVREAHKRQFHETHGFSLTYLPFVVHAAVRALREFPRLNASVVDESIVEKQAIHIGIATETEKGLVVPVVRHADRLSLSGVAAVVEDLSTRARSKKLSPDELRGGTFTISNPGRRGNLYGFAIINQPQVGILRMGEIVKRPVVRTVEGEDAILVRPMMHLALSYDHRAVDGAPANGFLYRVRELLEEAEFDL
jgi:2-oxoglutarate dehydrogenase E2 component (dihydrolipoamide succinyltransferase)